MLILFFDSRWVLLKEFVPEGQMVTKEFLFGGFGLWWIIIQTMYRRVSRALWANELHVWDQRRGRSLFQFPQRYAVTNPNNCAAVLGKNRVPVLSHPAYSPNLSPLLYFAFPKLKIELKGDHYKNISKIEKSVISKFKAIPIHEWDKAMKWLKDCAKECIHVNGDGFE